MLLDSELAWRSDYYPLRGLKCSTEAAGTPSPACRARDISARLLKATQASPPARQPLHHTGNALRNNDVQLALRRSLQLDWPQWQENNREFIASLPVIFTPSCFPREGRIPCPMRGGGEVLSAPRSRDGALPTGGEAPSPCLKAEWV